jgi:hypothetical protein
MKRVSPNVTQNDNGDLCWMYELSLWKNPTILITCWKVFMLVCGLIGILVFFLTLGKGFMVALREALMVFGLIAGILTGLLILAYPILSLTYGGKYCVLFEMNEIGVKHTQLKSQFKKAEALGFLTALLGAATKSFSTTGAGLLAATKQSQQSTFANVKSVKIKEKRHVIYVNETLNRNQVYAKPEDFPFVRDYIVAHCPETAKKRY